MIRAAFPAGIPEVCYQPLLILLNERLSFRRVAEVMACCTGKSYFVVYNDVLAAVALAETGGLEQGLNGVKKLLLEHGYDAWLAEAAE